MPNMSPSLISASTSRPATSVDRAESVGVGDEHVGKWTSLYSV
jgi:hypothetical protein